ncbi:hypothetical protein [Pedosphaera parvula]|uniref:Uncharacterized protein n=1 Tax=Pedosphaera parvula (strain Ellin514) TaxID=320771 RepID=B9XMG4_PEDPL|nr:hypothetical protein [Pedosphaera parvula]EEF59006.1 hypothetical protein Cflav_PD2055 [Pedosphaera parvula Ellin514]
MKSRIAWFCLVLLIWASASAVFAAPEEPGKSADDKTTLAAQEKEACIKNLKVIYEAIQAYQADKKDIPNWLSDLVPQYVTDVNVLLCPVCKRTGQTEARGLADPQIATSYVYEFSTALMTIKSLQVTKTRREWKRQQMGLAGSVVPIVRCRHHTPLLNLAYDGRIYDSGTSWETLLTNRMDIAELKPERIFAAEKRKAPATAKSAPARFPARDRQAKPGQLDLGKFYNTSLTESWLGSAGHSLAELPSGLQTLGWVDWDIRGVVQLAGKSPSSKKFPEQAKDIQVHQKCQRLHFLHAAGFGAASDEGTQIGTYIIHLATSNKQLEVPIIYGHDVRNWHVLPGEPPAPEDLVVAWTGSNEVSKDKNMKIRLFETTWINPAPDVEVQSVDFVSSMAGPAPFLIGITAE